MWFYADQRPPLFRGIRVTQSNLKAFRATAPSPCVSAIPVPALSIFTEKSPNRFGALGEQVQVGAVCEEPVAAAAGQLADDAQVGHPGE